MKAVVLWTGGKDSALALQVSLNLYDIRRLVCFVPADNRQFAGGDLTVDSEDKERDGAGN